MVTLRVAHKAFAVPTAPTLGLLPARPDALVVVFFSFFLSSISLDSFQSAQPLVANLFDPTTTSVSALRRLQSGAGRIFFLHKNS